MEMRKFRMMVALALGFGLLALVMTALLVVSAPSISHASPLDQVGNPCGYGFQIDVVPPLPTTNDIVSVTYSAEWPNSCVPLHQGYEVVGNAIKLDAVWYDPFPDFCAMVITPWGGEAGVGNLPSGTYTVQVYLTTVMTPTVFPPELCGTQSFTVYEELQQEPEDLYVAPTGTDAGNCTNSDFPCETVQYAVDQASEGSTIKVASGTYTDVHAHSSNDIMTTSVVTQVVYISKTVTIRGGYTTTNSFADPPNPAANPTILDAESQGRVIYITGGPSAGSGQTISPTIEGLRITGGAGVALNGPPGCCPGGGIYATAADVTIRNSQVFSNWAYGGGGLSLHGGAVILSGNTIASNQAIYAGGLYLGDSDAILSGNTIASNRAAYLSGGLALDHNEATLSGNTIISNSATYAGGMYLGSSDATLINNVIADNQAIAEGSGLNVVGSSLRLLHNTIARNSGGHSSGIYVNDFGGHSTVAMTNTILVSHTVGVTVTAGNTATLESTLWGTDAWANDTDWGGDGTLITGTVNLWGAPAFVDPDAGDYHIGVDSAAFNAGVDAGVTEDIDGDLRTDGHPDIGADELPSTLAVVKQADPSTVEAGARLTYTIRVTNTGSVTLTATVTDTLPDHITQGTTSSGTLLLPGEVVTWTPTIPAPDGVWTGTVVVTVEHGYVGLLTNVVQVATEEGATAVYTETSTAIILHPVYLPLVLRNVSGATTILGEYLYVGTPCTTDPCLPGLVYAVFADDTTYYPTVEGAWLWWNRSWNGYTPEIGDFVTVTGHVDEMVDVFGHPFHNIEAVSLEPASRPPTTTWNVVISNVHPYGTGAQDPDEYVEIRNDDNQPVELGGWTLRNASSRVFVFPSYLMQPGEICRVYTNEDHPEWCSFSYGSESDVWNHANDCAYLRDGEGSLVDAHCYCQGHTAYMTISSTATTLPVGEVVTVTATLFNRGCTGLGLPQYRLYVQYDGSEPIFDPSNPEPVVHELGIGSGQSDAAEFVLQAVQPGQATLRASTTFEVHLGYPGPAYWGSSGSGPLTITVTP